VIFDIINPKTSARRQIELDLSEAVMTAAKHDIEVAQFVSDLVKTKMLPGWILLGNGLATP
jgi:hypothetical protein